MFAFRAVGKGTRRMFWSRRERGKRCVTCGGSRAPRRIGVLRKLALDE